MTTQSQSRRATTKSTSAAKTAASRPTVAKALAKKAAVKKTTVKKTAPAKAVVAKKSLTKKTAVKKTAPAKAVVAKKAPAKKVPAKKIVAVKKATPKKAPRPRPPAKPSTLSIPRPPRAISPALVAAERNLDGSTPDEAPAKVALSGDQWNDKNRELFFERIRLTEEIAKIEEILPEERTVRMNHQLARLRHQHQDITYKIYYDNYGLLRNYVRKFSQNASREDIHDFEGAATVGLMRAISTYDPSKGRFAQWAFKPMQREVLRAVHSADHPNMNAGDFEKRPDILRAMRHLQNGDESARPSMQAIAAEAGVTVLQAKRVLQAPHIESIYTPVGDGTTTVGEMLSDDTDNLEDNVITRLGIKDLETFGLKELDPRELFVIIRRQGLDCEPRERLNSIGKKLGLSREAVRQIESRARGKLAHPVILRKLARAGRD